MPQRRGDAAKRRREDAAAAPASLSLSRLRRSKPSSLSAFRQHKFRVSNPSPASEAPSKPAQSPDPIKSPIFSPLGNNNASPERPLKRPRLAASPPPQGGFSSETPKQVPLRRVTRDVPLKPLLVTPTGGLVLSSGVVVHVPETPPSSSEFDGNAEDVCNLNEPSERGLSEIGITPCRRLETPYRNQIVINESQSQSQSPPQSQPPPLLQPQSQIQSQPQSPARPPPSTSKKNVLVAETPLPEQVSMRGHESPSEVPFALVETPAAETPGIGLFRTPGAESVSHRTPRSLCYSFEKSGRSASTVGSSASRGVFSGHEALNVVAWRPRRGSASRSPPERRSSSKKRTDGARFARKRARRLSFAEALTPNARGRNEQAGAQEENDAPHGQSVMVDVAVHKMDGSHCEGSDGMGKVQIAGRTVHGTEDGRGAKSNLVQAEADSQDEWRHVVADERMADVPADASDHLRDEGNEEVQESLMGYVAPPAEEPHHESSQAVADEVAVADADAGVHRSGTLEQEEDNIVMEKGSAADATIRRISPRRQDPPSDPGTKTRRREISENELVERFDFSAVAGGSVLLQTGATVPQQMHVGVVRAASPDLISQSSEEEHNRFAHTSHDTSSRRKRREGLQRRQKWSDDEKVGQWLRGAFTSQGRYESGNSEALRGVRGGVDVGVGGGGGGWDREIRVQWRLSKGNESREKATKSAQEAVTGHNATPDTAPQAKGDVVGDGIRFCEAELVTISCGFLRQS